MNTNKPPLLNLVEKLMFEDYVQCPISAICFEYTKESPIKVFTIKTVRDQFEDEFFKSNEVDLTLKKFAVPKQKIMKNDSTPNPVKRTIKPESKFLEIGEESQIPTTAEVVSQTEHAVLINELIATKYMDHNLHLRNEFDKELTVYHRFRNFSFGYIGVHPYTKKYKRVNKANKLYLSVYWGIKQFYLLDPDAEKIPINKVGM